MMKFLKNIFCLIILLIGSGIQAQKLPTNTQEIIDTRARVIIVNDFGGDPDGLFHLAHQLMSPTTEVKAIIGSKQYDGGFYGYPGDPTYSSKMATDLLKVMQLDNKYKVLKGAASGLKDTLTPKASEGAKAIIKEAMRTDTKKPLYVLCGAGLTDIASAYLMEPKIADRLTLIWIGGTEYEGLAVPPPGADKSWEYNTGIDPKAVQVIFNNSNIPIWQIPRNAYRQALISYAEMSYKIRGSGPIGDYLVGRLEDLMKRANSSLGEAYALGDSPLVLLTALQSSWEVDPSSSDYVIKPAPTVNDKGFFNETKDGRQIRVYTKIDTRLMFGDFFAKLALFDKMKE